MRHKFQTERLTLRQTEARDAVAFSKLGSDYDIARMTGSIPFPFPLVAAEFKIMTFHAAKRRGLAHPYAITLKDGDDAMIGVVDLFRRSADSLWEIGYWMGRPYWGQGYMTEACSALLKEADDSLGPDDRLAGAFTDNPSSTSILKTLGFVPNGGAVDYFSMARLKKAKSQDFILRAG